ncbi:hypothetical protein NDU88_004558 [Pleurodeles waltl]|uniref:Uncharacterized protein n=1 Tax=Pleurodeles waltl TaxID=8319 RepID=A0AAV7UFJ3_PLEWA|nr:hypothetical protein NDU88_004558 [Pleurodeles waltl]
MGPSKGQAIMEWAQIATDVEQHVMSPSQSSVVEKLDVEPQDLDLALVDTLLGRFPPRGVPFSSSNEACGQFFSPSCLPHVCLQRLFLSQRRDRAAQGHAVDPAAVASCSALGSRVVPAMHI